MTSVSIVILNWNRKKETIECLKSLTQLTATNYQLTTVVVDNGSSDGSVEQIKNSKFKNKNDGVKLKIIENKENLGFAGGNNVGIKYALDNGADFILLLNNDTIVDKNLIVQLIKAVNQHKDAGVLSPKIYFAPGFEFHKERYKKSEQGKVIWYAGGDIDWANVYGANHGVDEVDHGQYDKVAETDFATGAAMFLRREALKDVGLFDERYFMYLEDADLSMRLKRHGWKVLYAPSAHLWHKVAASSAIGSNLYDYFTTRNRLLFAMRYAGWRAKFALFRESIRFLFTARSWQKRGVIDFYLRRFGKGSWQ